MPECKSGKLVKNVLLFPKNFESDLAAGLAFFMITLTSISRNIGHTNRFQMIVMYKNVFQLKYFYLKTSFWPMQFCLQKYRKTSWIVYSDRCKKLKFCTQYILSSGKGIDREPSCTSDILFQAFYCLSRYPGGGQALNCQGSQTVEVDIPNYDWSCSDNDDRCPGRRMS